LAATQGRLIGLNLLEAPANFGRLLGSHAAMFVELDRTVHHDRFPEEERACASLTTADATGLVVRRLDVAGLFISIPSLKVWRLQADGRAVEIGKTR
jgi:hypothetical protein